VWIYQGYVWVDAIGLTFFSNILVVFFQTYCLVIYGLLLWEIVDLLLLKYKQINIFLSTWPFSKTTLDKAAYMVHLLNDSVDVFNDIFDWPLILIVAYTSQYRHIDFQV
jgi:hypothetical protein